MGRGRGVGKREKVQEISSINGKYKIGKVKNSIRNGEAKELTCMTRGCELRVGGMLVEGGAGRKGIKGRKKWNNYNSIINKIFFKKKY